MLGHMDSITRGEVLVIAATNRLESLDPAMIRPGRFDRSIAFFHPKEEGRKAILEIHTAQWKRGREEKNLDEIAKQTEGYTGADLEQLCRETFLCAVRRQFPNLGSEKAESSEFENFDVLLEDWYSALKTVKPKCTSSYSPRKTLNPELAKLISGIQNDLLEKVSPFLLSTGEKGSGIKSFLICDLETSQSRSMLDTFIIPSLMTSPAFKETTTVTFNEERLCSISLKKVLNQVLNCPHPAVLYMPRINEKFPQGDTATIRLFLEHLEFLRGEDVLLLGSSSCELIE